MRSCCVAKDSAKCLMRLLDILIPEGISSLHFAKECVISSSLLNSYLSYILHIIVFIVHRSLSDVGVAITWTAGRIGGWAYYVWDLYSHTTKYILHLFPPYMHRYTITVEKFRFSAGLKSLFMYGFPSRGWCYFYSLEIHWFCDFIINYGT